MANESIKINLRSYSDNLKRASKEIESIASQLEEGELDIKEALFKWNSTHEFIVYLSRKTKAYVLRMLRIEDSNFQEDTSKHPQSSLKARAPKRS